MKLNSLKLVLMFGLFTKMAFLVLNISLGSESVDSTKGFIGLPTLSKVILFLLLYKTICFLAVFYISLFRGDIYSGFFFFFYSVMANSLPFLELDTISLLE